MMASGLLRSSRSGSIESWNAWAAPLLVSANAPWEMSSRRRESESSTASVPKKILNVPSDVSTDCALRACGNEHFPCLGSEDFLFWRSWCSDLVTSCSTFRTSLPVCDLKHRALCAGSRSLSADLRRSLRVVVGPGGLGCVCLCRELSSCGGVCWVGCCEGLAISATVATMHVSQKMNAVVHWSERGKSARWAVRFGSRRVSTATRQRPALLPGVRSDCSRLHLAPGAPRIAIGEICRRSGVLREASIGCRRPGIGLRVSLVHACWAWIGCGRGKPRECRTAKGASGTASWVSVFASRATIHASRRSGGQLREG